MYLNEVKIKLKQFATCKQSNLLRVGYKFYVIDPQINLITFTFLNVNQLPRTS